MSVRRTLAIALTTSVAFAGLVTATTTSAASGAALAAKLQPRAATDDTTVWAAVLTTPLGFANAGAIAVNGLDDTVYVVSALGSEFMSVINGRTGLPDDSFVLPGDGGRAVAIDQGDDTIYTITIPLTGNNTQVQSRSAADPRTAVTNVTIVSAGDLAVDSLDDTVYVSHLDNTGVTYFSGRTPTATSTQSIGGVPVYGIAVDELDDTVWMSHPTINRIRSWNGTTGVLGTPIDPGGPAGSQPDDVAVNGPDDTIYVADSQTSPMRKVIYAVNGLTSAVTTVPVTYAVTGTQNSLAVDESTDRLFATSPGGNRMFIINGANPDDSVTINTGIGSNASFPGITGLTAIAVDEDGPNRGLVWGVTGGTAGLVASRLQAITQVTPTLQAPLSGVAGVATVSFSVTPTSLTLPFLMSDNAVWGVRFNGSGSNIPATRVPGTNQWTVTLPSGLPTGNVPVEVYFNGAQYAFAGTYTVQSSGPTPPPPPPPVFPPGAPMGVSAVGGVEEATVTWNPPIDPGTFAVSQYEAVSSPGGQTCVSTSTTCTITGLTAGTSYTFTVRARSAAGWGLASIPSNEVIPTAPAPPGAPTGVIAQAGDTTAAVSWMAPANAGASPILEYEVVSSPGSASCSTTTLSCDVTGLTNGTSYTFTVRAKSAVGWGPYSATSNSVTPMAPMTQSIMITGTRDTSDPRHIRVKGSTKGLVGKEVVPYVRFPGQSGATPGTGVRTVSPDGTFAWKRKTGKRIDVYFQYAEVRSNAVSIAPR